MKRVLGLDLGTTSIGWALVEEGTEEAPSTIIKLGVRVVPLTTDEKQDFERGKPQSKNATRMLKRGARRNLFRYKLRREHLKEQLKEIRFSSTYEDKSEEIRYFQTHDLSTRLRHTVGLIRRAFGVKNQDSGNSPLQIHFIE